MMMRNVSKILWDDASEAIPSFLVLCCIPMCYSIGDGIILGLVLYPFIKLFCGRGRESGWMPYALSCLLIVYLIAVK